MDLVFQPWVQAQTGTGDGNSFTGFYLGNGGEAIASTNGYFWGMYANGSSGTNASEAFRAFSNSLPVNATFAISWHNKGIGSTINNVGGFNLRNGNNTNLMTASYFRHLTDGSRFSFILLSAKHLGQFRGFGWQRYQRYPAGLQQQPIPGPVHFVGGRKLV